MGSQQTRLNFLTTMYLFGLRFQCCVCAFAFSSFFFFFFEKRVSIFLLSPVYCLWDSQTFFFSHFFIKNGTYDIIHTFKNYFTIIFLVFSFQQNKHYPNGPKYVFILTHVYSSFKQFAVLEECFRNQRLQPILSPQIFF